MLPAAQHTCVRQPSKLGHTPRQGPIITLPASFFCLQVRKAAVHKGIWPEQTEPWGRGRRRSTRGWAPPRGDTAQPASWVNWASFLHQAHRVAGLLLQALRQSLWSPRLGLKGAFLPWRRGPAPLSGVGGAGVCVPRGAGSRGALRAVIRAAANIDNAGDVDRVPGGHQKMPLLNTRQERAAGGGFLKRE